MWKYYDVVRKFIVVFIISFAAIEVVEYLLKYFLNFEIEGLRWGTLGVIIIWGFKFHIFCCLLPAIWASYKCRHKKCEHNHCNHE
jgi:hypothetical protein